MHVTTPVISLHQSIARRGATSKCDLNMDVLLESRMSDGKVFQIVLWRLKILQYPSWSWTVELQDVLGQMIIGYGLAHTSEMNHGDRLAVAATVHYSSVPILKVTRLQIGSHCNSRRWSME